MKERGEESLGSPPFSFRDGAFMWARILQTSENDIWFVKPC